MQGHLNRKDICLKVLTQLKMDFGSSHASTKNRVRSNRV